MIFKKLSFRKDGIKITKVCFDGYSIPVEDSCLSDDEKAIIGYLESVVRSCRWFGDVESIADNYSSDNSWSVKYRRRTVICRDSDVVVMATDPYIPCTWPNDFADFTVDLTDDEALRKRISARVKEIDKELNVDLLLFCLIALGIALPFFIGAIILAAVKAHNYWSAGFCLVILMASILGAFHLFRIRR